MPVLAFGKLRKGEWKFETSLDYIARPLPIKTNVSNFAGCLRERHKP